MNILVCMKQILDPEIPARDFRIDAERKEAERGSANLVTNIFCENALETALQFRERSGEGKITVLTYGPASAEDTLRKALAMKADAAAMVASPAGCIRFSARSRATRRLFEGDQVLRGFRGVKSWR